MYKAIFGMITVLTLGMILILGENKINCNDPHTWSTEVGVSHCAINGGK